MSAVIRRAREQGWAFVDEELEVGLRSVAAPIRRADGRVIAAINLSSIGGELTADDMRTTMLEQLLATAEEISTAIIQQNSSQPPGSRSGAA